MAEKILLFGSFEERLGINHSAMINSFGSFCWGGSGFQEGLLKPRQILACLSNHG